MCSEGGGEGVPLPPASPGDRPRGTVFFYFTARGSDVAPCGTLLRDIFVTHPGAYELEIRVTVDVVTGYDPGGGGPDGSGAMYRYAARIFNLTMDGEGPSVEIRPSIRGAAGPPDGDARRAHGGIVNESAVAVNGNIQVLIDRSAAFAIQQTQDGQQVVKWFAEPAAGLWDGASPDSPPEGSMLRSLVNFRNDPSHASRAFFDGIDTAAAGAGARSGWVSPPGPPPAGILPHPAYGANNFKLNASQFGDGAKAWLYVMAMDGIGNLGFAMQKIIVDEDADIPVITLPSLFLSNASGEPIGGSLEDVREQLGVGVGDGQELVFGSNWAPGIPRRNALGSSEGIPIVFADDDGINWATSYGADYRDDIVIYLHDLNADPPIAGRVPHWQSAPAGSERERMGVLSQAMLAAALDHGSHLRDGFYRIVVNARDGVNHKVALPGVSAAPRYAAAATHYFAVHTAAPAISAESPSFDALQTDLLHIKGTARSRFEIQRLWIAFDPHVLDRDFVTGHLGLPQERWGTRIDIELAPTRRPEKEGLLHVYDWEKRNVRLNPNPLLEDNSLPQGPDNRPAEGAELRRFTLRAFDALAFDAIIPHRVQVDATPPGVFLFGFNQHRPVVAAQGGGSRHEVWGNVHFRINVTDTHGLFIEGVSSPVAQQRLGAWWWLVPRGTFAAGANLPAWNYDEQTLNAHASWAGYLGGQFYYFPEPSPARHTENNAVLDAVFDSSGLGAGEYELFVMAKDDAGNWHGGTPARREGGAVLVPRIVQNQSRDYPELDEPRLFPAGGGVLPSDMQGRLAISGVARDKDGFDATALDAPGGSAPNGYLASDYVHVQFSEDGQDWSGEWIPVPAVLDVTGAVIFALRFFDPEDGFHPDPRIPDSLRRADGRAAAHYRIRVRDEAGVALGLNALDSRSKNPQDGFPERFGAGVRHTSFPHMSLPAADSVYRVFPLSGGSYSFVFDDAAPKIEFAGGSPAIPSTFRDAAGLLAALQGTIAEANLREFSISLGLVGETVNLIEGLNLGSPGYVPGGAFGFEWDLNDIDDDTILDRIKEMFDELDDGPQNVMLVAVDHAENIGRRSWSFIRDVSPPAITFTNISHPVGLGRTPTVITEPFIRGSFDDLSGFIFDAPEGVLEFEYRFNGSADWHSSSRRHVKGQSLSSSPWEIRLGYMERVNCGCPNSAGGDCACPDGCACGCELAFVSLRPGIAEGENALDVRLRDMAGNLQTAHGAAFVLDTAHPEFADLGWGPPPGAPDAPNFFLASWQDGEFAPMRERERVFSAASASPGGVSPVFRLRGEVRDANLRDLTARISSGGEELVVARAVIAQDGTIGAEDTYPPLAPGGPREPSLAPGRLGLEELPAGSGRWLWTLSVYQKDIAALLGESPDDGARRLVSVAATDAANHRSATVQWPFFLDSGSPDIEFHNLDPAAASATGGVFEGENNVFRPDRPDAPGSPRAFLVGSAEDRTGIRNVQFAIARWCYERGRWNYWFSWSGAEEGEWQESALPVGDLPAAPFGALFSGNWRSALESGYLEDGRADFTATWRVDHSRFPSGASPFEREGRYKIYVRAIDWSLALDPAGNGNPAPVGSSGGEGLAFFVDGGAPSIAWTRGRDWQFANAERLAPGFALSVSDGNALPVIRAALRNAAGAVIGTSEDGAIAVAATGAAYSAERGVELFLQPSLWSGASPAMSSGNAYTLEVIARDSAGSENYMDNAAEFVFDSVAPEPSIVTVITRPAQPVPPAPEAPGAARGALAGHVTILGQTAELHSPIYSVEYALAPLGELLGSGFDIGSEPDWSALDWQSGPFLGAGAPSPGSGAAALIQLEDNPSFSWTVSIPNTRNIARNAAFRDRYAPELVSEEAGGEVRWSLDGRQIDGIPALYWLDGRIGHGADGSAVRMMRLAIRARDAAGNVRHMSEDFWLFPDGDIPVVDIRTPSAEREAEGNLMSGRFTISGMASDNEHVSAVYFRVRLAGPSGGGYEPSGPSIAMHVPRFSEDGVALPGDGQAPVTLGMLPAGFEHGWYRASGGGSRQVFWSAPVNDRGELNAPGARGQNRIFVEVAALDATRSSPADPDWDTAHQQFAIERSEAIVVTGAPEFSRALGFSRFRPAPAGSDGFPIELIHLGRNSGNAEFSFDVMHETGISEIWYHRTDHATLLRAAGAPVNLLARSADGAFENLSDRHLGVSVAAEAPARRYVPGRGEMFVSRVTVGFDIEGPASGADGAVRFGLAHAHAGAENLRFPIFIAAGDASDAPPISAPNSELENVGFVIDNSPPFARHEHNPSIAGVSAPLGGSAGDSGGIDRVVVWFQNQAGEGLSWSDIGIAPAPPSASAGGGEFRWGEEAAVFCGCGETDCDGTRAVRLPFVPGFAEEAGGSYAIVVDRSDPMASRPRYGQAVSMGWAPGGLGQVWNFAFNSRQLPSGPQYMHFVAFDRAGNARHFYQCILVMNDAPFIQRVQLATDLRGTLRSGAGGEWSDMLGPIVRGAGNGISTGSHAGIFGAIRASFGIGSDTDESNIRSGITPGRRPTSQAGIIAQPSLPGVGARLSVENFTARNDFLALGIQASEFIPLGPGINERRFVVQHVGGLGAPKPAAEVKAGNVYAIHTRGDLDWRMLGTQQVVQAGYVFLAVSDGSALPDSAGAMVMRLVPSDDGRLAMPEHLFERGESAAAGIDRRVRAEFAFRHGAFGEGLIEDYSHGSAGASWQDRLRRYALFIVKIIDGDPANNFADFTLVEARVNNSDQTRPFAQLHDLNPAAQMLEGFIENAEDAQPEQVRAAIEPAPTGSIFGPIANNRALGGLWRTHDEGNLSRPGNIEPRRIDPARYGAPPLGAPYSANWHSLAPGQMDPHQDAYTRVNRYAFFDYDTVSGRVVLRGYAEDDQRINSVALYFDGLDGGAPGSGALGRVALLTRADWDPDAAAEAGRTGLLAAARDGVFFADSIDLYRHRVEWAFVWDTAAYPANFVVGDLRIRAVAYSDSLAGDGSIERGLSSPEMIWGNRAPPPAGGEDTRMLRQARSDDIASPEIRNPGFPLDIFMYNSIRVNVRPYIAGFRRSDRMGFASQRSLQGRRAFHRGEGVVVAGFNLGGEGADDAHIFINTRAGATGTGADARITGSVSRTAVLTSALSAAAGEVAADAAHIDNFLLPSAAENRFRHFAVPAAAVTGDHPTAPGANSGGLAHLRVRRGGEEFWAVNTGSVAASGAVASERPRRSGAWETPANTSGAYRVNSGWWTQPWNAERSEAAGSELWDSVAALHIWHSDSFGLPGSGAANGANEDRGGFAVSGSAANPWMLHGASMSIDPLAGVLFSSHNEGGSPLAGGTGSGANAGFTRVSRNAGSGESAGWIASNAAVGIGVNTGGRVTQFVDPIIHSSIFVSSLGHPWVASSVIGRNSTLHSWNHTGGVFVHGPGGEAAGGITGSSHYAVERQWYNSSWQNRYLLPSGWADGQVSAADEQFRNPRVATHRHGAGASDERIHVAYFDSVTGAIKYRFNARGQPGGAAFGMGSISSTGGVPTNPLDSAHTSAANAGRDVRRLWTVLDGRIDEDDRLGSGAASGWLAGALQARLSVRDARVVQSDRFEGALERSSGVGEHNDIAVTRSGFPVVVYFDAESERLRIAVSNSAIPVEGANWSVFEVFNGAHRNNPRAHGTGQYVSMRIDAVAGAAPNEVHISAFNGVSNNLVYIRGRILNDGTANASWQFDHAVVVDSVGRNVGRRSSISLDRHGNPWIAYLDNGLVGRSDGVKAAFFNPAVFDREHDRRALADVYGFGAAGASGLRSGDLAGWETMHVPAAFRVVDTNHELWGSRLGMENFPSRRTSHNGNQLLPNAATGAAATVDGLGVGAARFWSAAIGFLSSDRYRVAYWVE